MAMARMLWPMTVPSRTFMAANRVVVPCRFVMVIVPARPLFIGRPG